MQTSAKCWVSTGRGLRAEGSLEESLIWNCLPGNQCARYTPTILAMYRLLGRQCVWRAEVYSLPWRTRVWGTVNGLERLLRLQVPAIGWLLAAVDQVIFRAVLVFVAALRLSSRTNDDSGGGGYDQNVKHHWSESRSNGINCDRLQISWTKFSFEANQSLGDSGTYAIHYLLPSLYLLPWLPGFFLPLLYLLASAGRKNIYAVEEYVHWLAIKWTMLCHPILCVVVAPNAIIMREPSKSTCEVGGGGVGSSRCAE